MKENKNIIKYGLFTVTALCTFLPFKVFALENVNIGRELTEKEYTNLSKIGLDDDQIKNLDINTFNEYKDFEVGEQEIVEKYFKEYEAYTPHATKVKQYITEEITEEEYNNASEISTYATTHETSYKKLSITLSKSSNLNEPNIRVAEATLTWKKVPATKSYDVFGFYATTGGLANNPTAMQTMTELAPNSNAECAVSSKNHLTTYATYHTNWNKKQQTAQLYNYGNGISMKLDTNVTNCTNDLGMFFGTITGYKFSILNRAYPVNGGSTVTIRASYQHAQSSVTLNESLNYDFSTSGYGGAIKFNSSVASKYDQMGGVSATL